MPTKECPYAKSDMTPCYLKDGDLVVVGSDERCVGCERKIDRLRRHSARRPKPHQAGPPT